MIKVPKDFFANLTITQYREHLKLLPQLKDEKTQLYTMLAFTLAALSFFGIFAINPTLSTIAELRRKFEDLQFVNEKLVTKTQNLSLLQQKYQSMGGDMPYILNALPQTAEIPKFVAGVNKLLSETGLDVKSMQTYGVEITPNKKTAGNKPFSFLFSIEAEGSYDEMLKFTKDLSNMNRLVVIDSVSIDKDDKRGELMLNLKGRQYFFP